jgi:glycosyltransferase involved in cell wall biosynthesis
MIVENDRPLPKVPPASGARLAVLIATRNGAPWLDEQLQSVAQQDWPAIDIWASDDGSTDATRQALSEWATRWKKGGFVILEGPRSGFAGNFRSLIANPLVDGDYVAFCDQDDVWLPEKTSAAVAALAPHGERPALYCGRTLVVDEQGRTMYPSPRFRRPPHFRNAIVQSIGGGNTMVMNRAAHHLLRRAAALTDFISHDWFSYLLVTGAGGVVTYSPDPHVRYRQHPGNLVGTNKGLAARWQRLRSAFGGRFVNWTDHNLTALEACRPLLTPDALETIRRFAEARRGYSLKRALSLRHSGVYRQTALGQVSLYAACVLGKL